MKVLVACEESQRVCTAFREIGHEAYSCDIQECSGGHPEWHIHGDVLPLINGNCEFVTMDGTAHKIDGKWDLLIAHPPCTYLSNAGACRLYPKKGQIDRQRFQRGLNAKEFFMHFYNADCKKYVLKIRFHQRFSACRRIRRQYSHLNMVIRTAKKLVCGLKICLSLNLQIS